MKPAILFIALLFISFPTANFAESKNESSDRLREFARSTRSIVEIGQIAALSGSDSVPAADLALVLRGHWDDLFKGDESAVKFSVLATLCRMCAESPDAKALLPDLIEATSDLRPLAKKPEGPRNWEELLYELWDGRLGRVMNCVLTIGGADGFAAMYKTYYGSGDQTKLHVLIRRVGLRKDRANYLTVLSETRSREKNEKVQSELDAAINLIKQEKQK